MGLPKVVFVLGPPGAGKGTQCSKIVANFGYEHLSAGDLLRAERQRPGSQVGAEIEEHIRNGSIVPVEITCSLLEDAMKRTMMTEGGTDRFLIDGFPRNKDNLEGWQRAMTGKTNLLFVLFFDCAWEMCAKRCLSRGLTSGRSDDNEDSLKKRCDTYNESTVPILGHYDKEGLVRRIDAARTEEEVYEDVAKLFNTASGDS